jgi:HlyD family secretion protein
MNKGQRVNAQPEKDAELGTVVSIGREPRPTPAPGTTESNPPDWLARLQADRRAWIVAGVVLLLVAVVLLRVMRSGGTSGVAPLSQESVPLVSVVTPKMVPVSSTVSFTGTIYARYDIPIGVQGDPGRVVAIYVEAGDRVKRGQLLARLDQSVLVQQEKRLAASLEEARAQAALSLAEYRRAKGVEASGALSAEEIERRRAASVTDEARVNVAAAQLAETQEWIARNEIRSPVDGLVLTRTAELGQTASQGSGPLFRIARGGEVEMRGQVAEQDMTRIALKQPASVYLTGVARPFSGHVRLLGAVIDPKTRLGEIRIALDPDPALRPGAFASGEVTVGKATRPVLPQTAVLTDTQGSYVFVVDASDRVERRPVRITDTISSGVVVGSGLQGSERIVSLAGGFLRAGERVQVATAQDGAPAAGP